MPTSPGPADRSADRSANSPDDDSPDDDSPDDADATRALPVTPDWSRPPPPPEPPVRPSAAAAPAPDHPGHTRRWMLGALGGVVVGAAAGSAVALLRPAPKRPAPGVAPAALLDAIAAETALLAALAGTSGIGQATADALRTDHQAHLAALRALLPPDATSSSPSPSGAPAVASTTPAQLRAAETQAAARAATRSASAGGDAAVLLASISACEAGHAALLA